VDREVWLEQKCTCPMCRAKFCVLDVSFIRPTTDPRATQYYRPEDVADNIT